MKIEIDNIFIITSATLDSISDKRKKYAIYIIYILNKIIYLYGEIYVFLSLTIKRKKKEREQNKQNKRLPVLRIVISISLIL